MSNDVAWISDVRGREEKRRNERLSSKSSSLGDRSYLRLVVVKLVVMIIRHSSWCGLLTMAFVQ